MRASPTARLTHRAPPSASRWPRLALKLSGPLSLCVLAGAIGLAPRALLAQDARPHEDKPDRPVACPPVPLPGAEAQALWAALVPSVPDLALEDVLALSGLAFRSTDCANDCSCREWREEALAVPSLARALGREATRIDLSRVAPEVAFAQLDKSLAAGRAAFYIGPNETGVVCGTKAQAGLFFVRALVEGQPRDEARAASRLSELWELTILAPGTAAPALDPAARELAVFTHALAHAHRPPLRGACSFLDEPAINAWGLAALGLFAERLANDEHGISGTHRVVPSRVAFLRAGRAAAALFLAKAARRREAQKPGSGFAYTTAATEYKAELTECLVPLEGLFAGKDELALADPKLAHDAALLLGKAAQHERAGLLALEPEVLGARGIAGDVAAAVSLRREQPVPEKVAPELAKLAESPDADVRLLAVAALADTLGPAAHVALAKALLDRDGPVSEAALTALEGRNEPGLTELLVDAWDKAPRDRGRTDTPLQRALLFSLADRGVGDPAALATLGRALEDSGEGDEVPDAIPRRAASLLYKLEGVDAEPLFLAALKSTRVNARRAAVPVLDLAGSKAALAALEAALEDPDTTVRLDAASALGRRGLDKGIKTAIAALRDPSRDTRSAAVDSLTRCGAAANASLVHLLEDPDWRIRANACVILGRTGGNAELGKIAALDKDVSEVVRELAHEARAVLDARAAPPKTPPK